ncbi:GNAT family N-acetyltransferase [Lysobacter antibioticus]|uniref:Acetyltransferase family protein n=1 Tax=Lysobacter antibioticus TaxID=84531 RepID=A0A0S2FBM7_LYSAN|nr:GNAT family N-acetyltransferase [Lysobacter antibioticus]ALN80899.1 acetyltransferase family protein [Lysobacter antibioticus]
MTQTPLRIRPARADDRAAVLALLEETFVDTWRPQLSAEAIAAYRNGGGTERFVDAHLHRFVIAELDGRLAGFAHRDGGFVGAVHVTASARRHGVATQLMATLETAMREDGVAAASLETDTFNTGSQALYLALGYRETARYPDEEWKSGLTTIRYEKPL